MLAKPLHFYTSDRVDQLLGSVCEEDSQNCNDEDAFGDGSWAKFLPGSGPYLNKPNCVFKDDREQEKIPYERMYIK